MKSSCEKEEMSLEQADVFTPVLVVVKARTMMRLFLKEQMMLNFRDAEQHQEAEDARGRKSAVFAVVQWLPCLTITLI